jgi:hypothetical protein
MAKQEALNTASLVFTPINEALHKMERKGAIPKATTHFSNFTHHPLLHKSECAPTHINS